MLNRMKITWWAFGQTPEELAFLGFQVKWVGEEQLADVITEADIELAH